MTTKKDDNEMKRVLVVEDTKDIAWVVEKRLSKQFKVDIAVNGEIATDMINTNPYDLIVLDLSLPKKSGFEVLKDLRKKSAYPPVLILSGMNAVEDKVKGLKLGADDYLAKPFDVKELVARIDALLRRVPSAQEIVKLGAADLEMDLVARKVTRAGSDIILSPREFSLLEYLIRNKNKIVTRKQIAEEVWGHKFDAGTNFVDVYINYLRKSVDKDFPVKLITTVYGQGFVLKDE
ncbi:MAG: response regulator transcription factor [Bacteroidota bacterium]|nr:response regulator transcription factor [Bacteroidota bacterium]